MKISKLFHWLYAILMFLPILVFIPNAFYYGFNEHADAQEKTQETIYYQSNEINALDDFNLNYVYSWNNHLIDTYVGNSWVYMNVYVLSGEYANNNALIATYGTTGSTFLRIDNTNYPIMNKYFDFLLLNKEGGFNSMPNAVLNCFGECETLYVKMQGYTTTMSITDSMSYAWDSVWQNDLFSWSYDSFLTQPFLYITNLFNVPSTNTLLYCLSYWLNISIIWLCFDVVMYVPLLVHRWIDKGIVE